MFQFINVCAKYNSVHPYYKPTKLTYFLIISFLILFSYAFIIPFIIFIFTNSAFFLITYLVLSCYYLIKVNEYYEENFIY
jgi:hypothetical protein